MTPEQFVSHIREDIIEGNCAEYLDILEKTPPDQIKDPYWVEVYKLYQSLNPEERKVLPLIFRQVATDALACLFGILDGVSQLDDESGEYILTHSHSGKLNEDLADILLAKDD